MHLAPSTDTLTALVMAQLGLGMSENTQNLFRQQEQIINYQELGGIGFYGILNNDDNLLAMIIMTNGADMSDEYLAKQVGYNNV